MCIYEEALAKTQNTDAILVVEDVNRQRKRLHVSKMLLSFHSDYFDTLFNSEFKEKSMEEIEIKDVDFEDFATMLSLVDREPLEIKATRVENLLELADRFLMTGPKGHVENFIIRSGSFSRIEKLQIADRNNLDHVLERVLSSYNTYESFSEFTFSENFESLSDFVKAKIIDRFFSDYYKVQ